MERVVGIELDFCVVELGVEVLLFAKDKRSVCVKEKKRKRERERESKVLFVKVVAEK